MEKIKTPVQELISELKAERLAYIKMNVDCKGIDIAITKAESKLLFEREAIIDFAYSVNADGYNLENAFNQTFESYE